MTQGYYKILSNAEIAPDTWEMELAGDTSSLRNPGQFINIALEGLYLRRPISVCHYEDGLLTIIYKVVGKGTRQLSEMAPGQQLDVLCGLGNGFDVEAARGRKAAVSTMTVTQGSTSISRHRFFPGMPTVTDSQYRKSSRP